MLKALERQGLYDTVVTRQELDEVLLTIPSLSATVLLEQGSRALHSNKQQLLQFRTPFVYFFTRTSFFWMSGGAEISTQDEQARLTIQRAFVELLHVW